MKRSVPEFQEKLLPKVAFKLLFLLVTACFLTTTACTRTEETNTETDTAVVTDTDQDAAENNANGEDSDNLAGAVGREQVEWNNVDFNIMQDRYDEVSDRDISVASNQQVAVYSLNEPVLFDKQGNELRQGAEQKLQQISASIQQRYPDAQVRIYGYADREGSTQADKDLAQKRATAVQNWLTNNGNISTDRISVHTSGGNQPGMATNQQGTTGNNQTAANQDRKVSIVVYRGGNTGNASASGANQNMNPGTENTGNTGTNSGNASQQNSSTPGQTNR